MILLFDVGNTSIGMGLSDGKSIIETYRLITNTQKSFDEYYISIKDLIDITKVSDIVISSVVPRITELLRKVSRKFFKIEPLIIGPGIKTGIKLQVDNPKEVGADLICDAAGIEDSISPSLVIDSGTAIKYIYIKNKTIYGVVISPGIAISVKALVGNTALLPDIEIEIPKKVLGNSTVHCMQSGVTYGIASQMDGLIERIKEEVKEENLNVYLTGGLSSIIYPIIKSKVTYDPKIIFKGLLAIYHKNERRS